jgi:hypothetical protein
MLKFIARRFRGLFVRPAKGEVSNAPAFPQSPFLPEFDTLNERYWAAEAFVEQWTDSQLAEELPWQFELTCSEAETFSELFRAFGYPNTADEIIADHAQANADCSESNHGPVCADAA